MNEKNDGIIKQDPLVTGDKKKKKKKIKGFWNDENGLAITDGVSTVMTTFIIGFTIWVTHTIFTRPLEPTQLSTLQFVVEKIMYLMSIILVGHYGNGVIKTAVSSVNDVFTTIKKPLTPEQNNNPNEGDDGAVG